MLAKTAANAQGPLVDLGAVSHATRGAFRSGQVFDGLFGETVYYYLDADQRR